MDELVQEAAGGGRRDHGDAVGDSPDAGEEFLGAVSFEGRPPTSSRPPTSRSGARRRTRRRPFTVTEPLVGASSPSHAYRGMFG
ncbi:hypothetical protein E0500_015330 [Streptomyces sp. KM273126]|nr:hypothetical protein [Streptomyces sp. KM273126]